MPEPLTDLEIHPLTPERWTDLETLFGPSGASSGCWCMWWRASSADYEQNHGEPNRQAFKSVVASGAQTGLLAYQNGQPIGWISFAPREDFPRLERSTTLKRVDSQPVWSIVCFFISRKARRHGLPALLIESAVNFAADRGAAIVEAYPVDRGPDPPSSGDFTGTLQTFLQAGFVEVARHSPKRPIVRKILVSYV
ncbi:MAG TPA: GNAT family N-acetyltransferase [Bellilinea sp.]|nr:GNAT family N-acetyltransferase [Bellilinea sp.]